METLNQRTPAENLLLLQEKEVQMKDLLKLTYLDLCLKGVLKSVELVYPATRTNNERVYEGVSTGQAFQSHKALPHEHIFLMPFKSNPESKILFRNYIKMVIHEADLRIFYIHAKIGECVEMKGLLKTTVFHRLFGKVNLTTKGKLIQEQIGADLEGLNKELTNSTNQADLLARYLKTMNGNLFLLNNQYEDLLNGLDNELTLAMKQYSVSNYDAGCSGFMAWGTWDTFSDGFDSGFDAGGGCSGGSGCSGCSGCGGCGGCGGCS